MASDRRRSPRAIRPDVTVLPELPPRIAAIFLICFDVKAGYTVKWKRAIPEVVLENVVEYKSLPSGLHNVREDLVYFVHQQYAGISAFINHPAAESERNALMIAVGVLVPLSYGRLGKAWRHTAKLKELARSLADDSDNTEPLSAYWETHQLSEDTVSPPDSPSGAIASLKTPVRDVYARHRALSDATALLTSKQSLAPYHPALSLPEFLDTFGPLVFQLYRAALLRKRILLVGEAPVEESCNFVYDLALLSSLPQSLLPLLPATASAALRPRPLFSIGIHDMPYIASLSYPAVSDPDSCWIACTTDRVLSLKPELYDVLVNLPPAYSKHAPVKTYPAITLTAPRTSHKQQQKPMNIKATQRDARRYLALKRGLSELSRGDSASARDDEEVSDSTSTFSSSSIVEPVSWPLLAYTSFLWWASAGEKREGTAEGENEEDSRLLLIDNINAPLPTYPSTLSRRGSITLQDQSTHQPQEIALITYFRRLTTQIFTVVSDVIARQDENAGVAESALVPESNGSNIDTDGDSALDTAVSSTEPLLPSSSSHNLLDEDDIITITSSDMTEMGLDTWSVSDRAFVEELVQVWWGRKAQVHGARINCCGVRIL
ncbi:conserved hypothetical protein [Histoplasma capsulatum G186AR]|uniref:DUF4484 domain-containing protein n=2 Tax=Ajellomyces capsulatus TaxID=5037 RepID=C0NKX7_AJECG|nr:uncharacterized protein HCBG_03807 [Histoplasma capsulatum G186AR]EEH08518.1 conserved hypothetical protein [Histoplasma capsulatum G186AR]KAG5299171.1 Afi1 superfamily domain-containing protein [Histoplasma capsulatum]QSS68209.1 Afi1 superfamily domain-containing protein [Histoplasma capsulatum G186AR]